MSTVLAAPDLGKLAPWNPTLLVRAAGQSLAAGSSSRRVIYVASVAKQFTGFLAALLVTEGQWTGADHVRALVPELPLWADGIEIEHLVHHSSGLPARRGRREERRGMAARVGQREVLAAIARCRACPPAGP